MATDPCAPLPAWLGKGSLESLYDNVQVQCPGVTSDNVVLQTWNTIYDFYVSSTVRREHVYWCLEPGVIVLNFDPWDAHWNVSRFLAFRGLSRPKFTPPGKIMDLQCPADATRNGEALLSLAPKDLNTPLGDDFWGMWFDAIVNGIMGRLYMQPGKPYSDLASARIHLSVYRVGVNQARALAQSGNVTDGVQWLFPYFATGRPKNGAWGGG